MKSFDEIYDSICREYKQYEKEFNKWNEEIKREMLKIKRFSIKYCIISVLIIIVGIIVIFKLSANGFMIFLIGGPIVAYILIVVPMYKPIDKRKRTMILKYKQCIINSLVKNYSEQLNYSPTEGISKKEYYESGFDVYDSFESEDLIYGTMSNNLPIRMSDIRILKESDNGESYKMIIMFSGLFANIIMPSNVETSFLVLQNKRFWNSNRSTETYIKDKDGKKRVLYSSHNERPEQIELDSVEFEKNFDVFTEDKISTLRILTSDIMQMLIDFKKKYEITPEISLKHNSLYIRFEVGNVFEPNECDNLDRESIEEVYDLINFVFELTEKFSKNILEFEK